MVTVIGNLHFWTSREDVVIKDADIGAFRYQEKGNVSKERVYYPLRKDYIESRGGRVLLKNTRPNKLRESLKELEEIVSKDHLVWKGWISHDSYQMFFSTGLIAAFCIDSYSADITSVTFDKYLQGKLLSDSITDGVFTSRYFIFTYNDCRATIVHLTKKPQDEGRLNVRLATMEPKVFVCDGIGPAGRRFERKLSVNVAEDKVAIWWKSGDDEVYPWSPLNKDRDRANLLVYTFVNSSLHLLCYCKTEMSPLSVAFSKHQANVILTVEQGFDKKGGVTVLSCVYEVRNGSLHRISVTSIPLEAPLTAHSYNPSETRLLLACNNGVLALHCESRGMTHVTKAGLIPSCISWLHCGTLLFVSNDRGQMQCFDMALSLVRLQLVMEAYSPQRIIDISEYFYHQQLLDSISWAPLASLESGLVPSIPILLIHFANGPFGCLRFGASLSLCSKSIKNRESLSPYSLTNQYVKHGQFDEAVNLLVSLSWEIEGSLALKCLSLIVSALLKLPLNVQRETQLESALASFLVPTVPLSSSVEEEFGPPVRAMTRRFFFKVLRSQKLEKAYRLALDLKDHDCFLNIHNVARFNGDKEMASLALENARDIESGSHWGSSCDSSFLSSDSEGRSGSESCDESCSHSCSTCSSDDSEDHHNAGKDSMGTPLHIQKGKKSFHASREKGSNSSTTIAAPIVPAEYSEAAKCPSIESSKGVVTINIRQPETPANGACVPSNRKTPKRPSLSPPPPPPKNLPPTSASRPPIPPPSTVRDVYYPDPNKQFIAEEKLSFYVDKKDLERQYDQAVFQEVTTEEEDGSTVKVVHFGVV